MRRNPLPVPCLSSQIEDPVVYRLGRYSWQGAGWMSVVDSLAWPRKQVIKDASRLHRSIQTASFSQIFRLVHTSIRAITRSVLSIQKTSVYLLHYEDIMLSHSTLVCLALAFGPASILAVPVSAPGVSFPSPSPLSYHPTHNSLTNQPFLDPKPPQLPQQRIRDRRRIRRQHRHPRRPVPEPGQLIPPRAIRVPASRTAPEHDYRLAFFVSPTRYHRCSSASADCSASAVRPPGLKPPASTSNPD